MELIGGWEGLSTAQPRSLQGVCLRNWSTCFADMWAKVFPDYQLANRKHGQVQYLDWKIKPWADRLLCMSGEKKIITFLQHMQIFTSCVFYVPLKMLQVQSNTCWSLVKFCDRVTYGYPLLVLYSNPKQCHQLCPDDLCNLRYRDEKGGAFCSPKWTTPP